jgi:hypothetical protein
MNLNTIYFLSLFIPGLIAVLGNIIFYIIVKGRIDKSIERHKISYSGIHKEKIEIHKEILKQLFGLKRKIQQYQYSGSQELGTELFRDFNNFIIYYQINQPFLRQEILDGLKTISHELQLCFEDFYKYNYLTVKDGIDPKIEIELLKKFFESGNKFKKNEPFEQIETLLISEMKKDLKIEG